ncbi:putative C-mannosyltransferase DPY19L4 [Varanus komodoensis]|nr:putative C-mannosyltransferase DPY19L4 [Varanus komodoensis]
MQQLWNLFLLESIEWNIQCLILFVVWVGFVSSFHRMKYVWTPSVCMMAAFGVCSPELWTTLFKWFRLKAVHPIVLALILSMAVPTIIGFSLWKEFFPRIMTELSELQEFYDPDTVGLMTWIKRQAPIAAVFAGSPQLMGVIKLCTGGMVTNLPLYNDEDLLRRNEHIFQIYSKRSAEDIYKILTSYKANYLVIEDSICNEVGPVRGCRVKDLLDIANGHVYYEESDSYGYSKYGRFCQEIKMNYSPYVNYFTRVYWNRSYFVYKINTTCQRHITERVQYAHFLVYVTGILQTDYSKAKKRNNSQAMENTRCDRFPCF